MKHDRMEPNNDFNYILQSFNAGQCQAERKSTADIPCTIPGRTILALLFKTMARHASSVHILQTTISVWARETAS